MFFTFMCGMIRVILLTVDGNAHYESKEKLPRDQNYVLVASYRTQWEPLYLAVAGSPKKFSFMAKRELFRNPVLCSILKRANAFPVDHRKSDPSATKTPAKILKNFDLSLIIFSNDTRHSSGLRGGVALIAKMGQVPIVPSVYRGLLTLKGLFKHKKVTARFGDPTGVSDIKKIDRDGLVEMGRRMREVFDQLDKEIDPTFEYDSTGKE